MLNQMTLWDTASATSSPGSEGGHTQAVSLGGPTTAKSGQARRPASRSASQASSAGKPMIGIYGPTFSDSPAPVGPLCSWESRLRQRLARIGSTECLLTWKALTTPAGRLLSRLVPSMRPTGATDSGLLLSGGGDTALWITVSARDWKDTPGMSAQREDGRSRVDQLPRQVSALWVKPTAVDASRGVKPPRPQDTGVPLTQQVGAAMAMWPTALASDADGGKGCRIGMSMTGQLPSGQKATVALPTAVKLVVTLGQMPQQSSATTAKPGALNPAFPCWLQGYPSYWLMAAPAKKRRAPKRLKASETPSSPPLQLS